MKHGTKSRDLLYNNGIYRSPLQRYRAILTMVTRATLARSPRWTKCQAKLTAGHTEDGIILHTMALMWSNIAATEPNAPSS